MCHRGRGAYSMLGLALFVAFFLVHCYPAPQVIQQARALPRAGNRPQNQVKFSVDQLAVLLDRALKAAEAEELELPCMTAKRRKMAAIEKEKSTQTTTTTPAVAGPTMQQQMEEEAAAVLLRPVSWEQSSTRPTTKA